MKYRAEIDGLRALAVVPVILFHAGFELFSGGFVGVDVFFVISGYLITTILIEDIENKRFSIVNFYERRARRILPALYFVVLLTSVASLVIMTPWQLKDYGQSLVSVVTFSSNIFYWLEADYWAQSSEFLPLLHTWSLAVEEQYYVLFPIFLTLVWRFGKNKVFWMIVVIAAISLTLSELGWRYDAIANFYLTPSRAWEIFAGSIAAFLVFKRDERKNDVMAFIGLAAILFGILTYDDKTPFPSVYSTPPVIGTVLLIMFANKDTFAAKLLSAKIMVAIGLISYSLYLWHQPILALIRIYKANTDLSPFEAFLAMTFTLLAAVFTYNFVERKFRDRNSVSHAGIFYASTLPFIVFLTIGFTLYLTDGLRSLKLSLLEPKAQEILHRIESQKAESTKIKKEIGNTSGNKFSDGDGHKVLILGDSISVDLYTSALMLELKPSVAEFRRMRLDDNCARFIAESYPKADVTKKSCLEEVTSVLNSDLFEQSSLILLAVGWDYGSVKNLPNILSHPAFRKKNILIFKYASFTRIESIVEMLSAAELESGFLRSKLAYTQRHPKMNRIHQEIDNIAKDYAVDTINGYDIFCDNRKKTCDLFSEKGAPLLIDYAHLSPEGFEYLSSRLFLKLFESLEAEQ